MNASLSNYRWISFAAAPLVCLLGSALWAADETPATPAEPLSTTASAPDLSATQLTLEAIHLAANNSTLGADVAQVGDVLRSHLGLAEGKGLVVTAVADDGPAAKAGIQKNDVLTTIGDGGEEISDPEAFRKSLETTAGLPTNIGLIRAGKKQSVQLTPIAAPIRALDLAFPVGKPKYWLGLGLACADDALRSQLSLPAGQGLVVTYVEEKSPAAEAGVMVNDVLLQLDDTELTTIEALTERQQEIADKPVALKLLRRGKPATLTVTAALHTDAATDSAVRFLEGSLWLAPANTNVYSVNGLLVPGTVQGSALPTYVNLGQPFNNLNATPFVNWVGGRPDVAKQLSDLEAQLKQMEASLAALRAAIAPAAQPAESGEEKK